ncbi:Serine threonine-protein kinase pink1 [Sparganum proliferum]
MFRAYSNIAAVLRYCNDFAPPNSGVINGIEASYKRVETMRPQFPEHMRLSSLKPQSFLSNGCFGAVWSAKYSAAKELGVRCDLAVKVLYNFYAAISEDEKVGVAGSSLLTNDHKVSSIPVHWHLLNKQVRRECGLRPASYHPNIVPVWKKFFDKAPPASKPVDSSSASDVSSMQSWQKAEQFREGFGGRPITCYLVMPKFEATLDDIFNHKWHPPITATTALWSSPPCHPSSPLSVVPSPNYCLPAEEAVPLLAQMFEAVAELQRSGVAHRDLKPSNVLVRPRSSWSNITGVLDSAELELANCRLHVALTDFGCAIKTKLGQSKTHSSGDLISHSGNTIFWPPEVARHFANHTGGINPEQYSRADLWSAATIAYQVFGRQNPFLTNELSCLNYEEDQLPAAPPSAPGIVCWLLHACLRTDPAKRPSAHLVADALHVWCLLRNLSRRALVTSDLNLETETTTVLPQQKKEGKQGFLKELLSTFTFSSEEMDSSVPWLAAELTCVRRFCLKGKTRLCRQLTELLQICWASDWLLGPAQPPDGIRANFYARITLQRFAFCLGLVRYAHLSRILEAAAIAPITITPTS